MTHSKLIKAVSEARTRLPNTTWADLMQALQAEAGTISSEGIARVLRCVNNAEICHQLNEALSEMPRLTWSLVLATSETATHYFIQAQAPVEMVWTGPDSGSFSARRIDQILYDLLTTAKDNAFLITFSAYRVARLSTALNAAQARGVKITLLLETAADSEGQLSNDALRAFEGLRIEKTEILHWPRRNRAVNPSGKPGKLHAKCAVIDSSVVISSANLTDDAFNRNIEMGVVVKDVHLAKSVREHFSKLKATGVLSELFHPTNRPLDADDTRGWA